MPSHGNEEGGVRGKRSFPKLCGGILPLRLSCCSTHLIFRAKAFFLAPPSDFSENRFFSVVSNVTSTTAFGERRLHLRGCLRNLSFSHFYTRNFSTILRQRASTSLISDSKSTPINTPPRTLTTPSTKTSLTSELLAQ